MYSKKLKNGKVRFYDTYKSLSGKRKQITVTLETSSAQSQRTAKNLLAQKVDKKLDDERQSLEAINNAKPISNEIDTNTLGKIERDLLKESLKIVNEFKKFVSYIFKLDKIY